MKFQRMTDPKQERRMKREIDRLAHRDRDKQRRDLRKHLRSEGLKFGICCLIGGALGVFAYFQI